MSTDKADQEILFNALLAAQASIDAALREARLLVGMPEPPSEREKVLREIYEWLKAGSRGNAISDEFAKRFGIILDGDGNAQ